MKKYLLGLITVITTVTVASVITPKNTTTIYVEDEVTFQYSGSDYSESAVENPANWVEVAGDCGTCNNVNKKACRIKVNVVTTEGSGPNRTLKTTTIIVALTADCGVYAVVGGDVIWVCNKSC